MKKRAVEQQPLRAGGKARRKLHQLEDQRGYVVLESDVRGPTRVQICPMDTTTTWARVANGGKDAEFEIEF
jgi:hypothetical protein